MSSDAASPSIGAYADWKAPSGDGEMLFWPDPSQLLADTLENHARLDRVEHARLLGVPLNRIRREARLWIGHTDEGRPLVATGHQTELHHPGVWVKNAVINAAAGKLHGVAHHVAVDTDSPKHLLLRWPGSAIAITDDDRLATAAWSGLLDAPSPAHLDEMTRSLRAASTEWAFEPVAPQVIDSLRKLSPERPRLSQALCNALHELDWSLGLRHHAMTASPMFQSPSFLLLAAAILADARRFADRYNAALHRFRADHAMKTTSRPMPDLFVSETAIELPFWLDDLAEGHRTRPSAFDRGDGQFILKLISGEEIAFRPGEDGQAAGERLGRFLTGTSHRLAPRALTLTMFLRLFVADQFVHGIGGGRYDQVLDLLIADYFGIAPPKFSVATATLLFPTAVGRTRACVPCVVHEGHQLRHRLLGDRKREMVARIASQPRRSPQRYRTFVDMQTALREAWRASPAIQDWQDRLEQVRRQQQRDEIEFDRELFYGMQPRDRLAGLILRVQSQFR